MKTTHSIEINDRVVDADRAGQIRNVRNGRVLVQWTGGALEWIDLPAALARLVIAPVADRHVHDELCGCDWCVGLSRGLHGYRRCPNPADCGDPTCQGDCGRAES